MNEYYASEEFQDILTQYKNYINGQQARLLDSDEITDVAEYYHSIDQLDEAREAVELCLSIYPGNTGACCFYARMAIFIDKDLKRAEQIAEQIEDKSDIEYTFIVAEIMIAGRKLEEADLYLEENIDNEDEDYPTTCVDIAEMYADYHVYDYCEKWLRRSELTDDDGYKELMGIVDMNKGEYERSIATFNELIDSDPYSTQYWNHLATVQFMAGDIKGAAESLNFSLAIEPRNADAVQNMANCMHTLGNSAEALKYYSLLSELKPYEETGELFSGLSLIALKKYDEAVARIEKARDICIGNYNNARRKDYFPEEELTVLHGVLTELVHAYSHCGNTQAASQTIEQYLQYGGDTNMAEVMRAYVEMENGNTEAGMNILNDVSVASGFDAHVLLAAGLTAFDFSDIEKAYFFLSLMDAKAGPTWYEGYSYLAYCCYIMGENKAFQDYLRTACDRNPVEARMVLSELFPVGTAPEDYPVTPPLDLSETLDN